MLENIEREAALRLLRDGPPGYASQTTEQPMEQFEIEESGIDYNGGSTNWLDSVKRFSNQRIGQPVSRVVDPIVRYWYYFNKKIDELISRYFNPFIFKRVVVMLLVTIFLLVMHYRFFWIYSRPTHKNHERLFDLMKGEISKDRLRHTSHYMAKMPHLAGTQGSQATAQYVYDTLKSLNLNAHMNKHKVFLSHRDPGNINSTFLELRNTKTGTIELISALMEGSAMETDTFSQIQPPTQMALALPGDVTGPLSYAHFGSEEDFKMTNYKDSIAIVQYGHENPGDIALRAQQLGVRGLLFMSTKSSGEPMWPQGRDYAMESVQQGSLGSFSTYPGDILSPGWPSNEDTKVDLEDAFIATIPAAAISWKDAEPLLKSLRGTGERVDQIWGNNNGVPALDEWWSGPSTAHEVHLVTSPAVDERHIIQNVLGELEGWEDDNVVVIGARLDAMCYGTSQLSGLNVLLEVARVLSFISRKEHWQPLRSIIFALWDGTASNYAGSTEWVEEISETLRRDGISYIDLDIGISGPQLLVRGNPVFDVRSLLGPAMLDNEPVINHLHPKTGYPIVNYGNSLVFEAHASVPSIQLGFMDSVKPVPIDSCYDNVDWMNKFGDPDWEKHVVLTEVVTHFVLELADAPLLPYDFSRMGSVGKVMINETLSRWRSKFPDSPNDGTVASAFSELEAAADNIYKASGLYNQAKQEWSQYYSIERDGLTGDLPVFSTISRARAYWNEKAILASKAFSDINGINRRNWYKNHLFGPSKDQDLSDDFSGIFPGVQDAINERNRQGLLEALGDATRLMNDAYFKLLELAG